MDGIRDAVVDQMNRSIRMLRGAGEVCPEAEWRRADLAYARPAALALHTIETIDLYCGELGGDDFPWGHRFGIDWESDDSSSFPGKKDTLEYLTDCERKANGWLASADLLAPESIFPWTGPNGLGRAIYLIRHNQHHLSDICLELTRRGYAVPDWA